MNREIKFRAWNWNIFSEKWEMQNWDRIKSNCMAFFSNPEKYGDHSPNKEPHKIMQFTGIKDKNGIDIYEGDILKYSNWNTKNGFSPMNIDAWRIGKVYYRDNSFVVEGNEVWNTFDYKNIIVIGNIHENPELLK